MAQSWTAKQSGFVQRYATAVQGLLNIVDTLSLLNAEFTNDMYGSGGDNALTDAVVQASLPAATAFLFDEAEGAVVTILGTVRIKSRLPGNHEALMSSITKGSGTSVIASTSSTTTSAAQDSSGNYLTEVYVSIVQVGTATTPANVQVQVSPDGGTTYYSFPALLVTAGLAAGTYNLGPIMVPASALKWKAAFTQQAGGTSSTCVVQSNNVSAV